METAAAGDLPLIIRLINVGLIIFLAWLIYRLSWRLAGLFLLLGYFLLFFGTIIDQLPGEHINLQWHFFGH